MRMQYPPDYGQQRARQQGVGAPLMPPPDGLAQRFEQALHAPTAADVIDQEAADLVVRTRNLGDFDAVQRAYGGKPEDVIIQKAIAANPNHADKAGSLRDHFIRARDMAGVAAEIIDSGELASAHYDEYLKELDPADLRAFKSIFQRVVSQYDPHRHAGGDLGESASQGLNAVGENVDTLMQMLGDSPDARQSGEFVAGIHQDRRQQATEGQPEAPSISEDPHGYFGVGMQRAPGAVLESAPTLALAAGAEALGGPAALGVVMFSQTAPQRYREYRSRGYSEESARIGAIASGAAESAIFSAYGPLKKLVPTAGLEAAQKTIPAIIRRELVGGSANVLQMSAADLASHAVREALSATEKDIPVESQTDQLLSLWQALPERAATTALLMSPGAGLALLSAKGKPSRADMAAAGVNEPMSAKEREQVVTNLKPFFKENPNAENAQNVTAESSAGVREAAPRAESAVQAHDQGTENADYRDAQDQEAAQSLADSSFADAEQTWTQRAKQTLRAKSAIAKEDFDTATDKLAQRFTVSSIGGMESEDYALLARAAYAGVKYLGYKLPELALSLAERIPGGVAEIKANLPGIWARLQTIQPDLPAYDHDAVEKALADVKLPSEPGAFPPEQLRGPENIGIKNDATNEQRISRGASPLETAFRESHAEVLDEAARRMERSLYQTTLIEELKAAPRAIDAADSAVIGRRMVDLHNEFDDAATKLDQARSAGDDQSLAEQQLRADGVMKQLDDLENVARNVGTVWGRAGRFRQEMFKRDYSLAAMMLKMRKSGNGVDVTPELKAEIEALHARLKAAEAKLAAAEKELAGRTEHGDVQGALDLMGEKIKRERRGKKAAPNEADVLGKATARFGRSKKDAAALSDFVQELTREALRKGIKEVEPVVDYVHGELRKLLPDVTRRATMEAMPKYGQFHELNKESIEVERRDINGQVRQLLKLEDIQANRVPPKSGSEYPEPSDAERRLTKLVHEAMKKSGLIATDPAKQLKTALDAAKRAVSNTIADLEHEIETRQRIVKQRTALTPDAELTRLRERLAEMRAAHEAIFGKPELSDEQRVKIAMAAVESSIGEYERRIRDKDLFPGKKLSKTPKTPELEAARSRRDALKEQLKELQALDTAHADAAAQKRLGENIAALKDRLTRGDIALPEKKDANESAAVTALRKEQTQLLEQLEAARESAGLYDRARLNKLQESLERSIAEHERKIQAGDLSTKQRTSAFAGNVSIDFLRARRKALSQMLAQMRAAAKPKRSPEEIALQAYKARLRARKAELDQKLATGDFYPKAKKPPLKLDRDTEALKFEVDKLKAEFNEKREAWRRKNRHVVQKALGAAADTINLARAIVVGGEFSLVLRQGGWLFAANPVKGVRALPELFRAFATERSAHRVRSEIEADELFPLSQRAKLSFTGWGEKLSGHEETYVSHWIESVPWLRNSLGRFERANVTFLNKLRFDVFRAMVGAAGEGVTDAQAKVIANYVNVATGRSGFGKFEAAAVPAATLLFAPRYLYSRVQLLSGQPLYRGDLATRRIIAGQYARSLVGIAAFVGVGIAAGCSFGVNPTSPDFLKLKFGNTRIDPMMGLAQLATLIGRLLSGKSTSSVTGKTTSIRGDDVPYGHEDAAGVIGTFARQKLAPAPGFALDVLSGHDVTRQPVTPQSALWRELMPITYQDMAQAVKDQGVPAGMVSSMLAFFGVGVQTYGNQPTTKRR